MKRIIFILLSIIGTFSCFSQKPNSGDVLRTYEAAEKLINVKNFEAALVYLNNNIRYSKSQNDSLLYLKIRILDNLYSNSTAYSKELDSSLQQFLSKTNRYTFPELKYAEVAYINNSFQIFKEKDQNFYDSVSSIKNLDKIEDLIRMTERLANYLRTTPNSFYNAQLSEKYSFYDKKRRKLANNIANREILKKVGKGNVFTIGYSSPNNGSNSFHGFDSYNDVESYFNGTYKNGLGMNYSINASLAGALINIYAGSKVKASIVSNLFDGEYTLFDWSKDTLMRSGNERVGELKTIKAGTRIGPMITTILNAKIAAAAYYQARPGVQFILGKKDFVARSGTSMSEYTLTPKVTNYNLSHEVGIRFYFFKRVFINPYMHLGSFNWENELSLNSSSNHSTVLHSNYSFKYLGLRIGL